VRQDITQMRRVPVDGSAEVVTNINSLVSGLRNLAPRNAECDLGAREPARLLKSEGSVQRNRQLPQLAQAAMSSTGHRRQHGALEESRRQHGANA
jgi:hypothetical protein